MATINGGIGNDSLIGTNDPDLIRGLAGDDSIDGSNGNDTLLGGSGNDTLDGGTGGDLMRGGDGNDVIIAQGTDTIDAGAGDDLILWTDYYDQSTVAGGAGTDTVRVTNGAYATLASTSVLTGIEIWDGDGTSIRGTSGDNVLDFSSITLVNVAYIDGQSGNDSIVGNAADNDLRGDYGNDTLIGGLGNDTLNGGAGNDQINGGDGNDRIVAQDEDSIDAGAGDDLILWADYADQSTVAGGAGSDTIRVSNSYYATLNTTGVLTGIEVWDGSGTYIQGTSGDNTLNFAAMTLVNVTYVDGQSGNDNITGNGAANDLRGGYGNDTLTGGAGNDSLDGGAGNDQINGGAGNDRIVAQDEDSIDAGAGDDLILWADYADQSTVAGGAGSDTIRVSNSYYATLNTTGVLTGIEVWDGSGTYIQGTSGDNTLNFAAMTLVNVTYIDGQSGNDNITGNGAANDLRGGYGNDTLAGGAGNDSLDGGSGNDLISGGAGNDRITASDNDTIDAGTGDDLILWTDYADQSTVEGGIGTDTIRVVNNAYATLSGTSILTGIEVWDGNLQEIYGTNLDNVLDFSTILLINTPFVDGQGGNDRLVGGVGNDDLRGGFGLDTLVGGAGNDTLNGGYDNDSLDGGAGDDWLIGGSGIDTIAGGVGNDIIDYSYTGIGGTINLATQTSAIEGETFSGIEGAVGSQGANVITGSAAANFLDGQGGADSILGGAGNDTISGGSGNDTLNGEAGNDTVDYSYTATAGTINLALQTTTIDTDTLAGFESAIGSQGNNVIIGNGGANYLDGQGGADSIVGGAGDDTIAGGSGVDTVDGGIGTDTADFSHEAGGTINLATSTATIDGVAEQILNFENVLGSDDGDTIIGSAAANRLEGLGGDDSILGGAGNDTLLGGDGNDTMNGEAGADSLDGGAGDDLYLVDAAGDVISEAASAGTDTVRSSVSFVLAAGNNVENLVLTGGAIVGTGNELGNVITGNDLGNTLNGGGGADRLIGGLGNDTLVGGAGVDTLVWTATTFAGGDVAAGVVDKVTGGLGDQLDFSSTLEGLLRSGGATLASLGSDLVLGGTFTAGAGGTNVRFDAVNDYLEFDLNGNGGAFQAGIDFRVDLSGAGISTVTYSAADDLFLLS